LFLGKVLAGEISAANGDFLKIPQVSRHQHPGTGIPRARPWPARVEQSALEQVHLEQVHAGKVAALAEVAALPEPRRGAVVEASAHTPEQCRTAGYVVVEFVPNFG
jgi:hypothetical protein